MRKWITTYVHGIVIVLVCIALYQYETAERPVDQAEYVSIKHRDIMLPNMTLTDDIRNGMFLEGLRVDTSRINPDAIIRSYTPWDQYITRYAARYDVDADLVRAIIYAESKGDPFVISHVGASGLMQLMPVTASFMGIEDPLDPEENIRAGVKYISWLVRHHSDQNEKHLLWAWNAGPEKFNRGIFPDETKKFIVEVLSAKSYLKDGRDLPI